MRFKKLTFDRVRARDLKRRVCVYGWGQPGCLYDAGPFCATTKRDAIDSVMLMLDENDCKGARTSLRNKHGFYNKHGRAHISKTTLGDIL